MLTVRRHRVIAATYFFLNGANIFLADYRFTNFSETKKKIQQKS